MCNAVVFPIPYSIYSTERDMERYIVDIHISRESRTTYPIPIYVSSLYLTLLSLDMHVPGLGVPMQCQYIVIFWVSRLKTGERGERKEILSNLSLASPLPLPWNSDSDQ